MITIDAKEYKNQTIKERWSTLTLPEAEDGVEVVFNLRSGREVSTLVDACDVDAVLAYLWYQGSPGYLVRDVRKDGVRQCIPLHDIIVMRHGSIIPDGEVVDHINRNKTDNRSANLRVISKYLNSMSRINNSTGLTGVNVSGAFILSYFRESPGKTICLGTGKDTPSKRVELATKYDEAFEARYGIPGPNREKVEMMLNQADQSAILGGN